MRPARLAGILGGILSGTPATLVIFAGQSNALGYSSDAQNTSALTNGRGYEFRPTGTTGVYLPLGRTLLGMTQGGAQSAFAETWTAGGGGVCLCVNAAVGGASLDDAAKSAQTGNIATLGWESLGGGTWDLNAGGLGSLYNQGAKAIIDKAIVAAAAAGFSIAKKVVVWVQGESDGNASGLTSGAAYSTRLQALIDKFVTDFAIDAFLISALGTPGGSANAAWDAIRTAQSTAAAAKSSVATIAFSGAVNFFAAGKMVDTLHYTQAGYNDLGAGCATAGLAFIGGLALAAPPAAIFNGLVANPPALDRWKRLVLSTTKNGAFGPNLYSGPLSPNAVTWVDNSGANKMRAQTACAMSFGSAASKDVYVYVSDQIGVNGNLSGGASMSLTAMSIKEGPLKLNAFGLSDDIVPTFVAASSDLQRFDPATFRTLSFSTSAPATVSLSNSTLSYLSGLTYLNLQFCAPVVLDFSLFPNLATYIHRYSGLTTANINTILIALDALGTSGKTANLDQYRASPAVAVAPPSGAGITAKASLIAKGWTVTTD